MRMPIRKPKSPRRVVTNAFNCAGGAQGTSDPAGGCAWLKKKPMSK
jgi:hypothetical protein